jgi:C_GCAxxG_C_C family probable redox protein
MLFKSGSALAGGVALQGDTCGALIGAVMAIGCIVGRERLPDKTQARKSYEPAKEMYRRFQEKVGETICSHIHRKRYGKIRYLANPDEARLFHEEGGHSRTGCPEVCGIAAREAAEIIFSLR